MRFKDGDHAENGQDEIATMLHKLDKNNLLHLQALLATRFDHMQAQYASTQTSYNEPS